MALMGRAFLKRISGKRLTAEGGRRAAVAHEGALLGLLEAGARFLG